MSAFHYQNGVLHAESVPLTTLAETYGTPAYIYSASSIRTQYEALAGAMRTALPPQRQPLLCFACKANSNTAILRLLKTLGSGLEIVSEGELRRGLKAGFDPARIVSTGVGKQASEITTALKAGIHQFNVESLPELAHIQQIAQSLNIPAHVVFRLNPDVTGGGHHKISTGRKRDKFGLSREMIFTGFTQSQSMSHIRAVGLSMHIGSQVFTVEAFKQAFEKLPVLVAELRAQGHTITRLDIGGGFPIVYKDETLLNLSAYAQWVRDIILPLDTEIIMEPGRYLVGNAGVLLSQVLYVKETQDRRFLVIDSAMNDLIRPTLYEAYHGIAPVLKTGNPVHPYDVVGPVCETGDTFSTDRALPAMNAGDLLVIQSAGAYGFSMASNYNTRPMPPEILVDGARHALIRPRQTYEDLLGPEAMPEWL